MSLKTFVDFMVWLLTYLITHNINAAQSKSGFLCSENSATVPFRFIEICFVLTAL